MSTRPGCACTIVEASLRLAAIAVMVQRPFLVD
jgi:hypothetical protein